MQQTRLGLCTAPQPPLRIIQGTISFFAANPDQFSAILNNAAPPSV